MKKVLAAVLAAAMSLSMASVAFGLTLTAKEPGTTIGNSDNTIDEKLDKLENKTEIDAEGLPIYTYDNNKVEFKFPYEGDKIQVRADVASGKVSTSVKTDKDNKIVTVTVKGTYGVRDFKLDDWKVELDINDDTVVYLKGQGAYSGIREVNSGDRLVVSKTKRGAWSKDQDTDSGTIFDFKETLDEETRIRCHDYVDVYFKGNYGTDRENMRVKDEDISEVQDLFDDIDVDCYDFIGTPKFATKVKVIIDGDKNAFLYEYDKKTGDVTRVDATWESEGWAFTTKTLGTYVLAEEEYPEGNVKKEEVETDKEPVSAPDKTNPGTGANDMVGVAAALAVVSLVAAGAVAFKKASK